MAFKKVIPFGELWNGEMRGFVVDGRPILLVKLEDRIYSYEDACPHLRVPLSEGHLESSILTCAAHHWQFDVLSGEGVNPLESRLKAVPNLIQGPDIWIDASQLEEENG